jgi:predicted transcriptional regulator
MENNLKEIRKEKGVSQVKLSRLTLIAPSDISRIENGWLRPYPGWRKRLADALGESEEVVFPKNGHKEGN